MSSDTNIMDPWDWTVDRVVQELCSEDRVWEPRPSRGTQPDPASLERALREQEVTGGVLLREVDDAALKNDLGIKVLGRRVWVREAIDQLRKKSQQYNAEITRHKPITEFSHIIAEVLARKAAEETSNIETTEEGTAGKRRKVDDIDMSGNISPTFEATLGLQDTRFNEAAQSSCENGIAIPGAGTLLSAGTQMPDIVEINGKKRKRLAPTLITSSIDHDRNREIPHPLDHSTYDTTIPLLEKNNENVPSQVEGVMFRDANGRKHMVPISQQKQTRQSSTRRSGPSYLGRKKMPVDSVFYSNEIGADLPTDDVEELSFVSTKEHAGQGLYVNGLMKRFLASEYYSITRNGEKFLAKAPYKDNLAVDPDHRSLTLFSANVNGEASAKREIVSSWPEIEGGTPGDTNPSSAFAKLLQKMGANEIQDFDYLEEKYRNIEGGDLVLPIFGESDSENDYDIDTWEEMEAERGAKLDRPERFSRKTLISFDDVNHAMDQAVSAMVDTWNMKVRPKKDRKAWRIWCKSRRDDTKREQARITKEQIAHLDERISKLRAEILQELWTSKNQVIKQSQVMEPSISERESMLHLLSVLQLRSCPEKPAPAHSEPKPSKKPVPSLHGSYDSESLGTEDEDESSEDGLDGFVVEDDPLSSLEENQHDVDFADSELGDDDFEMPDANQEDASPFHNPTPPGGFLSHKTPTPKLKLILRSPPTDSQSNTQKEEQPQPSAARVFPANDNFIDLTVISSDDSPGSQVVDLITPVKPFMSATDSGAMTPPKVRLVSNNTPDKPPLSDPVAVNAKSYDHYTKIRDRVRILVKRFYKMGPEERAQTFAFIEDLDVIRFWSDLQLVGEALSKNKLPKKFDADTVDMIMSLGRMFLMFARCQYVSGSKFKKPSREQMAEIEDAKANHSLAFLNALRKMNEWFSASSKLPIANHQSNLPSSQLNGGIVPKLRVGTIDRDYVQTKDEHDEDDDIDDVDDEDGEPRSAVKRRPQEFTSTEDDSAEIETPRKKIRVVKEDAAARKLREREFERIRENAKRKRDNEMLLMANGQSFDASRNQIVINQAATKDQKFICINEYAGSLIKPHQIDGVRFLWDQIVVPNADEGNMQGCLLAHTMGLGKTMQTITLLVAIAEAAKSEDPEMFSQIPPSLRESKTLVLCPPGLVENWYEECHRWGSEGLGRVQQINAKMRLHERLRTISEWYSDGGVLIMGYTMFKGLVLNKPSRNRDPVLTKEEHADIEEQILQGPNLVVADEAHMLKNVTTGANIAASMIHTRSRIALTGSPLANNVTEYYQMIDWVAPNYLGPAREFNSRYTIPIQEGLYQDSGPSLKRRALKMLDVLKSTLEPKVNRADMSVMKHDLPRKTEFVFTIPLTELQEQAYIIYVDTMLGSIFETTRKGDIKTATLWTWLALLSLLCNHPKCFLDKIESSTKKKDESSAPGDSSLDEGDVIDLNASISVPQILIDRERELFNTLVKDMDSDDLSYKSMVVCQILDLAESAGDKTLIFSQSIPTLNLLENMCKRDGRSYYRLDGITPIKSRQAMARDFNKPSKKTDVCLISTKAGGLGLNLFGANRVIIFDFKYNPQDEEQAVGRSYRIGQQKETFVYRFVAGGTFEELVQNKAVFKTQLASRVVDKKNAIAWATKAARAYLFHPQPIEPKDLASFEGMDPLVLDKLLATSSQNGQIRAIIQTDTFAREDDEQLTAEEKKEVAQHLADEKLRRLNPKEWHRVEQKRSEQALAALRVNATAGPSHHAVLTVEQGLRENVGHVAARNVSNKPGPSEQYVIAGPELGLQLGDLISTAPGDDRLRGIQYQHAKIPQDELPTTQSRPQAPHIYTHAGRSDVPDTNGFPGGLSPILGSGVRVDDRSSEFYDHASPRHPAGHHQPRRDVEAQNDNVRLSEQSSNTLEHSPKGKGVLRKDQTSTPRQELRPSIERSPEQKLQLRNSSDVYKKSSAKSGHPPVATVHSSSASLPATPAQSAISRRRAGQSGSATPISERGPPRAEATSSPTTASFSDSNEVEKRRNIKSTTPEDEKMGTLFHEMIGYLTEASKVPPDTPSYKGAREKSKQIIRKIKSRISDVTSADHQRTEAVTLSTDFLRFDLEQRQLLIRGHRTVEAFVDGVMAQIAKNQEEHENRQKSAMYQAMARKPSGRPRSSPMGSNGGGPRGPSQCFASPTPSRFAGGIQPPSGPKQIRPRRRRDDLSDEAAIAKVNENRARKGEPLLPNTSSYSTPLTADPRAERTASGSLKRPFSDADLPTEPRRSALALTQRSFSDNFTPSPSRERTTTSHHLSMPTRNSTGANRAPSSPRNPDKPSEIAPRGPRGADNYRPRVADRYRPQGANLGTDHWSQNQDPEFIKEDAKKLFAKATPKSGAKIPKHYEQQIREAEERQSRNGSAGSPPRGGPSTPLKHGLPKKPPAPSRKT